MPPRLEREIREWLEQRGQRTCEVEKNWDQGQALDAVMVREPWRWRRLHRPPRSDSLGKREEPARGGASHRHQGGCPRKDGRSRAPKTLRGPPIRTEREVSTEFDKSVGGTWRRARSVGLVSTPVRTLGHRTVKQERDKQLA